MYFQNSFARRKPQLWRYCMENEKETSEKGINFSYYSKQCHYNGDNFDYETACDGCDYYLICFHNRNEITKSADKYIEIIKNLSDNALKAFLRSDIEREEYSSDQEINMVLQVMQELSKRRTARGETVDAHAAWEKFCKYYRE